MSALAWWLPLASLLTLAAGLMAGDQSLRLDWLLLGSQLGIDDVNRPFMVITGLAWLAASLVAIPTVFAVDARAIVFYSLAFLGNLVAVLSQDLISFYSAFALLGFAAYGIVVGGRSARRRLAGRVYIALTIGAELLLFAAMVWLAHAAQSTQLPPELSAPAPVWVVLCLIFGFGVKAGIVPLHVTLPLTYGAAPLAGGVALAGAALNVGLLGWLRWLPASDAGSWSGWLLVALGIVGYLYAIVIGCLQNRARALLGYSSVSQAGLMTLVIGIGLIEPASWSTVITIVALMMTQHAAAKTLLFVASDLRPVTLVPRAFWLGGMLLAGLALAGAPLTGGYVVKTALTDATLLVPELHVLGEWLWLGSFLTTLLMARLAWLIGRNPARAKPRLVAIGAGVAFAGFLAITVLAAAARSWTLLASVSAAAPILAALVLAAWLYRRGSLIKPVWRIPPGDLAIVVAGWVASWLQTLRSTTATAATRRNAWLDGLARRTSRASATPMDTSAVSWPTAAARVLGAVVALATLLILLM